MSDMELSLFQAFLRHAHHYLEFGTGGSTYLATQMVSRSITSIDSSQKWLDNVAAACKREKCRVKPSLFAVDIGPTADWGYPTDQSTRNRWPVYHEAIWERPESRDCDLYLVDGRFRVACFMQVLLHCRPDALIVIHDFTSRPQYHVIRRVAREIASAEDLTVFLPKLGQSKAEIMRILNAAKFVTV